MNPIYSILVSSILPISLCAENINVAADSLRNPQILRFEIDNDAIWNEDSNFSNGWSIQLHSQAFDNWESSDLPSGVQWFGTILPGMSQDNAYVRFSQGIGQNMITPGDLSLSEAPKGDLPYAGSISYSATWQSFNENSVSVFQVTAGALGELSMAQQLQEFIHHDLGIGEDPQGWGSQRKSEPLLNLEYLYEQSIVHFGNYDDDWVAQLSIGASASIGNIVTAADIGLAIRTGWNIPQGFSTYPAPPGRGLFYTAQNPKPYDSSPYGIEFIAGINTTGLLYCGIYDGSILTNDKRKVERNDFYWSAIIGVNYYLYSHMKLQFSVQTSSDLLNIPDSLFPDDLHRTNSNLAYGTLALDCFF